MQAARILVKKHPPKNFLPTGLANHFIFRYANISSFKIFMNSNIYIKN